MNKLILLSILVVSYVFGTANSEIVNTENQTKAEKHYWDSGSTDDFKADAGRRRGKGNRGRRRGGGGLR